MLPKAPTCHSSDVSAPARLQKVLKRSQGPAVTGSDQWYNAGPP